MLKVPALRLHMPRGLYLLIAVGLALTIWPLFFELIWKVIWVMAYGIPLWRSGTLTAATRDSLYSCLAGIVLVSLALPWGYVLRKVSTSGTDRRRGGGERLPAG